MVQIEWTKQAVEDLNHIYEYIAQDSKKYARLQVIRIRMRTRVLKTYPKSGKVVPEFIGKGYRELIEGNYRIIYLIKNPEKVGILTIHHSSRDMSIREF